MNARFYLLIFVPRFIIDTAAPSFYLLTRKGDAESCEGVPGRLNLFFKRVDSEKKSKYKVDRGEDLEAGECPGLVTRMYFCGLSEKVGSTQ